MFSYSNSSEDASYISRLSFVMEGSGLLAFFMNERVVYVNVPIP
jgi:hypothetical protein